MKYATLTYSNANNLGDDLQSLAAMQFLPRVDAFIDRDFIGNEKRKLRVIGNAYWEGFNENDLSFPPKKNIDMLPIAIHIANKEINLDWFRANQPIGCRDENTARFLRSNGIYAYFSGCLTLTFPKYEGERKNRALIVGRLDKEIDIPRELEIIKIDSVGQIKEEDLNNPEKRLNQAREWLELLKTSKLVISRKVHAIFPCIAMGTPIIPIITERNKDRLSGYDLKLKNGIIERPEVMIKELKDRINKWI